MKPAAPLRLNHIQTIPSGFMHHLVPQQQGSHIKLGKAEEYLDLNLQFCFSFVQRPFFHAEFLRFKIQIAFSSK